MSIIQRVPWKVQPQAAVVVDRSNPITHGLVFAQVGNTVYDRVGAGKRTSGSGSPTSGVGTPGLSRSYNSTADFYSGNSEVDLATSCGMFAQVNITALATNAAVLTHTKDLGTTQGWASWQNRLDALVFYDGAGTYRSAGIATSVLTSGGLCTLGGGFNGTAYAMYRNGLLTASGTGNAIAPGAGYIKVAGSRDVYGVTGDIFLVAIWDRLPTAEEYASLHANPYQLFAPLPRRIWVPVSAGGVATHDASGALVGPGAVIAGSAAHIAKHATTGALVGPGSTVAGASARTRAHPTSGALTGPGSVVSGAADHTTPGGTHDTTGGLVGPGAVIAGSAAHIAKHTTSGALVGPGSVISGAAAGPATAAVNRAGGFRRREGPRKGYIIKGKRYWLTDEELSIEIALMLAEVSRSDIKEVTAGKPKTISKRTWDAIRPLERMEALVPNYDEDDEEALLMLM